jgi:hypothetical protein
MDEVFSRAEKMKFYRLEFRTLTMAEGPLIFRKIILLFFELPLAKRFRF